MQLDRLRLVPAVAVAQGLAAARARDLSAAWFEAMALVPGQAEELAFRQGSEQDLADLKAEVRGRW